MKSIISSVDDVGNLLIQLDFGYIRTVSDAKAVEASNVINELRETSSDVRISLLSSSYPRSPAAINDRHASLEIEERAFHEMIGGDAVSIYGDHASVHPIAYPAAQSRFVPRIDYPTANNWIYFRYREDDGGYVRCAEEMTSAGATWWNPQLVSEEVWGAKMINQASQGNLTKLGSPGPWISVRVNLHLWRQIHYLAEEDFEDEDIEF